VIPPLIKISLPLLILLLITSSCANTTVQPATLSPSLLDTPATGWYSVYFTDPGDPITTSYRDGFDEELAAAINAARVSVDMAIYDLNLWSIRDALINAHQRGIDVRVVTESDNTDEQEIQDLKDAGIQVVGDRHEGLMHDKFVVIDRSEVWTGSVNFTTGSVYLDNNHLIRLHSSKLASDYTAEFEQMFVDDHFGNEKSSQTPDPTVSINGSLVEVYFSPTDGTLEHILSTVKSANESITFLAYSFTSDELADALIERANAGIRVQGVFDKDQYHSNNGTEYDRLLNAGVEVRLDGNPRLMHDKVIIIDQQVVITGSYNFSNNAEYNNDENTLIIHDQQVAKLFADEFEKIYSEANR